MSYATPDEVRQRAEAHSVSLSTATEGSRHRIEQMLATLQVKAPPNQILDAPFISNLLFASKPIWTEDLISLVLVEERKEALKLFVGECFPGCSIVEVQHSTIIFQLPTKEDDLISEAFEKTNSCPPAACLEDFIIKHSTLDMVFKSFAGTDQDQDGLVS